MKQGYGLGHEHLPISFKEWQELACTEYGCNFATLWIFIQARVTYFWKKTCLSKQKAAALCYSFIQWDFVKESITFQIIICFELLKIN